jgi:hypothetical protein
MKKNKQSYGEILAITQNNPVATETRKFIVLISLFVLFGIVTLWGFTDNFSGKYIIFGILGVVTILFPIILLSNSNLFNRLVTYQNQQLNKGQSIVASSIMSIIFGLIFFSVGAGFSIGTLKDILYSEKSTGEVIELVSDGHEYYSPKIKFYLPSGKEIVYISQSNSNHPPVVGKKLSLFYRKDNPNVVHLNTFSELYLFPIIFGGLGLISLSIGIGFFVRRYKQKHNLARLKHTGYQITANIESIKKDTTTSINGQSPYKIYATGQDFLKNKIRKFMSEEIWLNNLPQLMKDHQTIEIYIDRKNPKKYSMDTSFLPQR